MEEKKERIYIGFGKFVYPKEGMEILKFSINPDDVAKIGKAAQENKGWVNLDIKKKKTPSAKSWYISANRTSRPTIYRL